MRVVWGKQLHGEIPLRQMLDFRQTTILERERPPWGIYLVAGLGKQTRPKEWSCLAASIGRWRRCLCPFPRKWHAKRFAGRPTMASLIIKAAGRRRLMPDIEPAWFSLPSRPFPLLSDLPSV